MDAGAGAVATGLGASPGVATGVAVSDMDQAMELASAGTPVVLVRPTTAPEDVPAMFDSVAVVTDLGGSTSHAALVCREIGLPCVVGCGTGTSTKLAGRTVTVDGNTGQVYEGDATTATGAGRSRSVRHGATAVRRHLTGPARCRTRTTPWLPFVSQLSL